MEDFTKKELTANWQEGMTTWDGLLSSKYYLVDTMPRFFVFLEAALAQPALAVDTETNGFDWVRNKPCGISVGWGGTNNYYLPYDHLDAETEVRLENQLNLADIREGMCKLLGSTSVVKIFWNAKFDLHMLLVSGIPVAGVIHDAMIACFLLDENTNHKLKASAARELTQKAATWDKSIKVWRSDEVKRRRSAMSAAIKEEQGILAADPTVVAAAHKHALGILEDLDLAGVIVKSAKRRRTTEVNKFIKNIAKDSCKGLICAKNKKKDVTYDLIPISDLAPYACSDVHYTWLLHKKLFNQILEDPTLVPLYMNEMRLARMLFNMEHEGVKVNRDYLVEVSPQIQLEVEIAEKEVYDQVGYEFNIGSSQQLIKAIQSKGIKLTKITKGSREKLQAGLITEDECTLSCDAEVLEYLASKHSFAKAVLDYRGSLKIKGTYIDSILNKLDKWDFIHSTFTQNVSTGRMCLAAGSLVQMPCDRSEFPNGVPIEDIKAGDLVYSCDEDKNLCLKRVLWAGKTGVKKVMRLKWEGGRYLDLTPEHRVRAASGSYVQAQNLAIGDAVMGLAVEEDTLPGDYATHFRIHSTEELGYVDVYDLEVEDTHNFIAAEICVHNSSKEPNLTNIPARDTRVKEAFIVPDEEHVFVFIDFSQIEVRVTAHYSQDPLLLSCYPTDGSEGRDVHSLTAAEVVLGLGYSEFKVLLKDKEGHYDSPLCACNACVAKEARRVGKCVHHGTMILDKDRGWGEIGDLFDFSQKVGEFQDVAEPRFVSDGRGGWAEVLQTYNSGKQQLFTVVSSQGIITCTGDHLFLLESGDMVKAIDLNVDTVLATSDILFEHSPYLEPLNIVDQGDFYEVPWYVWAWSSSAKERFLQRWLGSRTNTKFLDSSNPVFIGQVATLARSCGLQVSCSASYDFETDSPIYHITRVEYVPGNLVLMVVPALEEEQCVDLFLKTDDHLYQTNTLVTHNTVNFLIIYGGGPGALQMQISSPDKQVSFEKCKHYIENYMRQYRGVKRWLGRNDKEVMKSKQVQNLFGRYRRFPDIQTISDKAKYRAFRQASNFLVQGCQDPKAPILTTIGYIPLDELEGQGKPPLITYSGTEDTYEVLETGEKECLEVVTSVSTGVYSLEHKFMVYDYNSEDLVLRDINDIDVGEKVVAWATPEECMPHTPADLLASSARLLRGPVHKVEFPITGKRMAELLLQMPKSSKRDNLLDLLSLGWAVVQSKTPVGAKPTMDLSLAGPDHTYIGRGLVQHNSSADLFKYALVRIAKFIEGTGIKIVNVVHDDLQFYCPVSKVHLIKDIVAIMEDFNLSVPIIADVDISTTTWKAKVEVPREMLANLDYNQVLKLTTGKG
ncbi:MAG: DNA polymerase [Sulfurovum sp.]|nr:DNA polymerase [Sulfurovum sp.]